jgi:hypothetical protein
MLSRSILLVKYVDCQLEGFAFLFLHFQQKVMRFNSFFYHLLHQELVSKQIFSIRILTNNNICQKNKPNSN